MKKLLIITSRRVLEFQKYWKIQANDNMDIVYNGYLYQNDKKTGLNFEKILLLIDQLSSDGNDDYYVFIHTTSRFSNNRGTTSKGNSYTLLEYSTQNIGLRHELWGLWSWGANTNLDFECKDPVLPFDLLCCALRENNNERIVVAVDTVINWFEKKLTTELEYNKILKYFLCCMTREMLESNTDIISDMDIFPEGFKSIINEQISVMRRSEFENAFKENEYQMAFLEVGKVLNEITKNNQFK